ncbi:MAG: hypothetical protein CL840_17120 [Crocinitomicaceae bacterium]|nr:hypothetical protein [Crocinitomicaceae bacterium]|tara:strand:- start:5766 stop:6146 length:381 start_codon:yes stop_codon:yes gene_type:complete
MTKNRVHTTLTIEQKIKTFSYLIGGLLFCWFWFFGCEPEKRTTISGTDAAIHAEEFVLKRLKAPISAEFCPPSIGVQRQINDTTYFIKGCVDSQNGFGAMIRSRFSCTITYYPSIDKVSCEDFQFY